MGKQPTVSETGKFQFDQIDADQVVDKFLYFVRGNNSQASFSRALQ